MKIKYVLMCGGHYEKWETPRHLTEINGEPIVARTIRLLRENGVTDIAISTDNEVFEQFGVPLLRHNNDYVERGYNDYDGFWHNAFYPTNDPVCYIFGDVVFSPESIKTIVETETNDIEFFASAPPFDERFYKKWAEPFALKVVNQKHLKQAKSMVEIYAKQNLFARSPIMWELWQVIKQTPLNIIDYENYTVINDYTCDIDDPEDIEKFKEIINND